ncbi:MAG: hypothetical protein R2784_10185 [Saprospiraceae bacterium]
MWPKHFYYVKPGKNSGSSQFDCQAEEQKIPCAPIRDLIAADDLHSAYAVQKLNTDFRVLNGDRIVGRKIGLTSKAVKPN